MPRTVIEQWDPSDILQPVQRPEDARQDAVAWGPNLTISAGDMIAVKTTDNLCYRYANGGANGLGTPKGFAMYSFKTDANGKVIYGGNSTPDIRNGMNATSPIWIGGIFDPTELKLGGVAFANAAAVIAEWATVRALHQGFVSIGAQ